MPAILNGVSRDMTGSASIRNVVLVTVDSLGAIHLGEAAERGHPTPILNEMFQSGINCENAFAHSWNTQFSYPSVFTSTLPAGPRRV